MTGIILRKNTADYFEANLPQEGELVYATDTQKVGSIDTGTITWQDWGYQIPDEILTTGTEFPSNEYGVDGDKYIMTEFVPAKEKEFISETDTSGPIGEWDSVMTETPNFFVLSLPKNNYTNMGRIIWFNKDNMNIERFIETPDVQYNRDWGKQLCYSDGLFVHFGISDGAIDVRNEVGDFIMEIIPTNPIKTYESNEGYSIRSVEINSDFIYIGCPWGTGMSTNGNDDGTVFVYTRDGNFVQEIIMSDQYGEFGMSLALDDRYLVVSAGREDNNKGAVYVLDVNDYSLISHIINPSSSAEWMGYGKMSLGVNHFYVTSHMGTNSVFKFSYDGTYQQEVVMTTGNSYPYETTINDSNIVVLGNDNWLDPILRVYDLELNLLFTLDDGSNDLGMALLFHDTNKLFFVSSRTENIFLHKYQIGGFEEGYVTREFKKESDVWREMSQGASLKFIEETFSTDTNEYLGQRNDYHMDVGYVPTFPNDVATKGYLTSKLSGVGGSGVIKLDGSTSEMDEDHVAVEDEDILTKNTLLQGDMSYFVPDSDPFVDGAIWNKNGILEISDGEVV